MYIAKVFEFQTALASSKLKITKQNQNSHYSYQSYCSRKKPNWVSLASPGNSRQNKASSQKVHKIVLHLPEILRPKPIPRPLEIPRFFLGHRAGNSTLFLLNLWKFHLQFLQYPQKFHILDCPCLVFFWDSPLAKFLLYN